MNTAQRFATIAAFSIAAISLHAESIKLKAALTGADEVPAKQVSGTGTLTATLDTDTNTVKYHVEYTGLTGSVVAAHFHGPAAPGTNAKPQVPVKAPFDSPINAQQPSLQIKRRIYWMASGTSTCIPQQTLVVKSAARL